MNQDQDLSYYENKTDWQQHATELKLQRLHSFANRQHHAIGSDVSGLTNSMQFCNSMQFSRSAIY